MSTQTSRHLYEFGPFRLDPEERTLARRGEAVPLTPKVFDILHLLVRSGGRTLAKDDFMREIWPDSFVEEGNLNRNISTLRRALGDGRGEQLFIETVPKRGYRFVAEVRESGGREAARAVAVLPFKAVGAAGGEEQLLGLGMADAVITKLSNLGRLSVRPTSAILKYTADGEDVLAVGRALRVDAVLDGRIQRAGARTRVTVQLVNVSDGATLWAEKFDEGSADIFAVQDSISERVAGALTHRLSGDERRSLAKHYTESGEAYQSYLRGRYEWNRMSAEGLAASLGCFAEAVAKDPSYALAHAGAAASYVHLEIYGLMLPSEAMPKARAAALRALELDETVAEAHASLALVRMFYDRDWAGAESSFRRALALNPSYAAAHDWYAIHLMARGRREEALASVRRAQELDPLSLVVNTDVGCALYYARRFRESVEQCRWILETEPNFVQAHYRVGLACEQMGEFDEAVRAFRTAVALSDRQPEGLPPAQFKGGSDARASLAHTYALMGEEGAARRALAELLGRARSAYVPPHDIAMIYSALGERAEALAWLEKAYDERYSLLVLLELDPRFDRLRSDPRFASLVARLGFGAGR